MNNQQEEIDAATLPLDRQNTKERLRYEFVQRYCYISKNAAYNLQIRRNFLFFTQYAQNSVVVVVGLFTRNSVLKIVKKITHSQNYCTVEKLIIFHSSYSFIIQTFRQIEIWNQNKYFNWVKQKLFFPISQSSMNCTLIHENDQLIANCNNEGNISFWRKSSFWEYQQMIQLLEENVCDMSLNKAGNKLFVIGSIKTYLLEYKGESMWTISKVVQIKNEFNKIRFFSNKMLVSMPYRTNLIEIYECLHSKLYFNLIHTSSLPCDTSFPKNIQIEYLQSLDCISITKDNHFFLLRNQKQGDRFQKQFSLEQHLRFPNEDVTFTNSLSGDYLITNEKEKVSLRFNEENQRPYSLIKVRKLIIIKK